MGKRNKYGEGKRMGEVGESPESTQNFWYKHRLAHFPHSPSFKVPK